MVLMNDGTVYGCGNNNSGQLGDGTTTNRYTLTAMNLSNLSGKIPVAISCGSLHTMVLMSDGTVYGCGYNVDGQLGDGTTTDRYTLTAMTNNTEKTPVAIDCGVGHTIVLMNDGTVYGCGNNYSGQLGDGTDSNRYTLTAMTNNTEKTPVAISCGSAHTIVLMSDGSVYGSGYNYFDQLGDGTTTGRYTLTAMTNTTEKIPVAISCGAAHTMVLMNDGTVYGCGNNNSGQLGDGTTVNKKTLTDMNLSNLSGKTPVAISCGCSLHTIVLMNDGTVYSCGYNGDGQLGYGTSDFDAHPLLSSMTTDGTNPITDVVRLMDSNYTLSFANICFPAHTPILTDQGRLPISTIRPKKHTIGGEPIVAITRTISLDNYLVCFDRHSLGPGIPSEKTSMSKDHKVVYNKQLVSAKDFLIGFRGVYKVKYKQEILYNVLMPNYRKINVNNMTCESLDPRNPIAKLHNSPIAEPEKYRLVVQMNDYVKKGEKEKLKQLVCKL
jgi:hypothetical protein